ncbi:MAG: HEAT repeat domain-containing protein [Myxococcota bacterium]|nr:HEAT repeat domain-containing protein [Myxococcota bacterium]
MKWMLRWGCLLLVGGLFGGCQDKNAIVVTKIVVNAPRQLDDDVADKEAIRASITEWIDKDSLIQEGSVIKQPTHFLRVRIGDVFDALSEDGGDYRMVTVELKPLGHGAVYRVDGRGSRPEDLRGSVMGGFKDAMAVIAQERRADLAGEDAFITLLRHEDWRIREFTLDRVASARMLAAVPFLCEALIQEDVEPLRLRIVGVLAELGDQRAVGPLIKLTRYQSPAFLLQVLHALGAIGGKAAEAFLVTVAGGHAVEGIRQVAIRIVKEMESVAASKPVAQ